MINQESEQQENKPLIKVIHFSGTSTTAEETKKALPSLNSPETLVIDGIGTKEHSEKILDHRHHYKALDGMHDAFDALKTSIKGYSEKDHIGQIEQLYEPIVHIFQNNNNNKELTLQGHSRGASGGVTGCLAVMYAYSQLEDGNPAKARCKDALKRIDRIKILALDPVAGPFGNDLLGVNENLKGSKDPIRDILKGIEALAEKKLFEVEYIFARYDSRTQFEICPLHEAYATDPHNNAMITFTGFQHSAMLETDPKSIAPIYPDPKKTPTKYIDAKITEGMHKTPEISSNSILKEVEKRELNVIKSIKNNVNNIGEKTSNTAIDLTLKLTSRDGYGIAGQVATHSDFEAALLNDEKNPNNYPIKISGRVLNDTNPGGSLNTFSPKRIGEFTGKFARLMISPKGETSTTLERAKPIIINKKALDRNNSKNRRPSF